MSYHRGCYVCLPRIEARIAEWQAFRAEVLAKMTGAPRATMLAMADDAVARLQEAAA